MSATSRRATRAVSVVMLCAVVAFAVLMGVAMARYPGGTWFDPQHVGHDFFGNFLSDLLHGETVRGEPNPASGWASAGLLCLLAALPALWWVLGSTTRTVSPSVATWIVGLGAVSTAGVIAVVLMPTDRFPTLHGVAALAAGGPGVAAAILGVIGQRRTRRVPTVVWMLGAIGLACAVVNLALYVHHQVLGAELTRWVPASQKCAALAISAWMAATAWIELRRE